MKTKEERIYEWALQVSAVEMVKELNKTFGGLMLRDEYDVYVVTQAVDDLVGRLTKIGDLSGTNLGIPYWTQTGERKFRA